MTNHINIIIIIKIKIQTKRVSISIMKLEKIICESNCAKAFEILELLK